MCSDTAAGVPGAGVPADAPAPGAGDGSKLNGAPAPTDRSADDEWEHALERPLASISPGGFLLFLAFYITSVQGDMEILWWEKAVAVLVWLVSIPVRDTLCLPSTLRCLFAACP